MPIRTYLHVGIYKSGTSALQQKFFPLLPGNHHIGLAPGPHPWRDDETELAVRSIVSARRLSYDHDAAARPLRRHLGDAERRGCTLAGISYENFPAAKSDPVTALERMAAIFGPDVRIVYVVRRPAEWLRSAYAQQLRARSLTLTFGEWVLYEALRGIDSGTLQTLLFRRYFLALSRIFSPGNVLVLPYCWFRDDPSTFLRRIADHLGTEAPAGPIERVNVAPDDHELEMIRRVNQQFPRWDGLPAESAGLYDNRWRIHEYYARLGIDVPAPVRLSLERDELARQAIDAARKAGVSTPARFVLPDAALRILAATVAAEVNGLEAATGLPLRSLGYLDFDPGPPGRDG